MRCRIRRQLLRERNDPLFCSFTNDVELTFKLILIGHIWTLTDNGLEEPRAEALCGFPDAGSINWHFTPTQEDLPLFLNHFFKDGLLLVAEVFIAVGKDHTDAVLARCRQFNTQHIALPLEEGMWNLN